MPNRPVDSLFMVIQKRVIGINGTSDVFPDHAPALCRMAPLLAILPNGLPS